MNERALSRRRFFKHSALAAGAALTAPAWRAARAEGGELSGRIKKAVKYHMVTDKIPPVEKFRLVKELGYDGIEIHRRNLDNRKEMVEASETTGLPIHGVLNSSDADLKGAVDMAKDLGASSVLYVAGRVNEKMPYDQNYRETQALLRQAAPHAEKQGIKILVENVWNNFLLSPLEMARYLDEVGSPAVGAYFDVGNVVRFGWPEHWIRILGRRIGKLDIKEYSRKKQVEEGLWKGFQVQIGEGDIDWAAVREALKEIDYQGWATAEVPGGDRSRLGDIARRMDQVLGLV